MSGHQATAGADETITTGARAPIHAGMIPLGAGLLFAALVTDLAYLRTVSTQWETFSIWLITGGLLMALVAALALIADLVTGRTRHISALKFIILASAVVTALVNAFVHSRDGYTAVAPTGIGLSVATAVLLAVASWGGWSLNADAARRR